MEVSADGSFGFGAITYEAAGEYTYTISEKAGDDPNMAYDDTEYTVVVTVADNNEGALVITVKVNGEDKELTQEESVYTLSDISFANKTKFEPATGNIEVIKKLEGRSLKENEFEFTLTPVGGTTYYGNVAADDVPMPEETAASNDADGKVLFGDITYETEGEYVYEIRETKGSLKNVQYDENVITAHVFVTTGVDTVSELNIEVTFDNDVDTFENIYTPDPVSQALAVKKTLNGRPWQDWDEFTFKLTAKDGAPAPAEAASLVLLKEQINQVLSTLTEREEQVLRLRFGLEDGRSRTLEEVGKKFNVTRERIRQIEAKALRKLRHPNRSNKVRDYLD